MSESPHTPDLPVMLKVAGLRCVVVGGGSVAARRAAALLDAGAQVTVIAPQVIDELTRLNVALQRREYETGDLSGARLVVVATSDEPTNERIARDAAEVGVLINRADAPDTGDLTVPAHARHGPITLAVHTAGISASAAAAIRRQLSEALDPDWPRLLEAVAPYRRQLQQDVTDPTQRQQRLRRLTDEQAVNILKTQGIDALHEHCDAVVRGE